MNPTPPTPQVAPSVVSVESAVAPTVTVPQGGTPPTAPVSGEDRSSSQEQRRGASAPAWHTHADRLAKLAVAALAGVYITGFVVAVHHYTKAGVPIAALTHDVFLAAGALFIVITGIFGFVGLVTAVVMREIRREKGWRKRIGFAASALVLFMGLHALGRGTVSFVLVGSAADRIGLLYCAAATLFGAFLSIVQRTTAHRVSFAIFTYTVLAPMFSLLVYSHTPQWFGGARPATIAEYDPRNTAPPPQLAEARCTTRTDPAPVLQCRRLHLLFWDEKFVYLAVEESDRTCGASHTPWTPPSLWGWRAKRESVTCLLHLPADRLNGYAIPEGVFSEE